MTFNIVGSRDLIQMLLAENRKGMKLDEMRRCAVGLNGNYRLAGASCPIVVDGVMSYDRFEKELQRLKNEGKITLEKGLVKPCSPTFEE
ncbi:MAG: hypothetical protein EAX81_08480 [Candidatus Thorarchaeota archaeon]|nr:hypothetical protein [Candidatus Thorarchaeota archaeon]